MLPGKRVRPQKLRCRNREKVTSYIGSIKPRYDTRAIMLPTSGGRPFRELSLKLWISRGKLWKTLHNWGKLVKYLHKVSLTIPPYMGGGFSSIPYSLNLSLLWKNCHHHPYLSTDKMGINIRFSPPKYAGLFRLSPNRAKAFVIQKRYPHIPNPY